MRNIHHEDMISRVTFCVPLLAALMWSAAAQYVRANDELRRLPRTPRQGYSGLSVALHASSALEVRALECVPFFTVDALSKGRFHVLARHAGEDVRSRVTYE